MQSIHFTDCDLSAIVDATNAFSGCSALTALTIPSGEWLPDLDLSATAIGYSAMADVIIGLHTYASGTHTVTFNATIWDALTQAQQQTISDAAGAKGWTTNAVAVVYVIRGTSTNVNGTETFNIQFIQDNAQTPDTAETITVNVDANGDWSFEYSGKKIYSLNSFSQAHTTLLSCEITEDLNKCISADNAFNGDSNLASISLPNALFNNIANCINLFYNCSSLTTINLSQATFAVTTNASGMFSGCTSLTSVNLSSATLSSLDRADSMFKNCTSLTAITWSNSLNFANLQLMSGGWQAGMFTNCQSLTDASIPFSNQTFAKVTNMAYAFYNCKALTTIDMHSATFDLVNNLDSCFSICTNLTTIDISNAIFGGSAPNPVSMFNGCTSLTRANLSLATFGNSTNYASMFNGCTALASVDLSSCTFASATNTNSMFKNCTSLEDIDWSPNISFDNLQLISNGWQAGMFNNCQKLKDASVAFFATQTLQKVTKLGYLFYNCKALTTVDMHSAVLGLAADTDSVFSGCNNLLHVDLSASTLTSVTYAAGFFDGCSNLIDIKLDSCLFDKVSTMSNSTYRSCNALTTFDVPQNSTAILPTSTAANAQMDLHWSPLTYTSMLKVANWLSDLTGNAAHTLTFKTTAWNALTAAEQSNIDAILTAKNWTRVLG